MFVLVSGACGAGKTALCEGLKEHLPQVQLLDADVARTLERIDDRPSLLERCVQRAIQNKDEDTIVFGQSPLGELLACPSAIELEHIAACLLDCHDVVRTDRVRARQPDSDWFDQHHLSWAAWHRMHAVDPGWTQQAVTGDENPSMRWERWTSWRRGDPRWRVFVIDTTTLNKKAVVDRFLDWKQSASKIRSGLTRSARWWSS